MGYIKGRSVSLLLRLIDNVIDQLNVSHKPSFLITVDHFHAFDRVSKHFVLKAFEKKKVLVEISLDGFPFYWEMQKAVWVIVDNFPTFFFAVGSETRPRCSSSPLAFVLLVELLAIQSEIVKI